MNRWDEIRAVALDVAQHVTEDPAKRDRMADDLLRLVGLMVAAVGKGVAIEGEDAVNGAYCNDPDCDCAKNGCHDRAAAGQVRCETGESMQRAADKVVEETTAATCKLDRWKDTPGAGWFPRCNECGQRPDGVQMDHAAECRERYRCPGATSSSAICPAAPTAGAAWSSGPGSRRTWA